MNPFDKIEILKSDITTLDVDAIVNAANSSLLGGGGVDGAIHRAAGPALLAACKDLRKTCYQDGLSTGKAVITAGFNLPAKYVIHTVGPVWRGGRNKEAEQLTNCYKNSLDLCLDNDIQSIAFPAISTGVYGYPKKAAVAIVLPTVIKWLANHDDELTVIFALINDNYDIYKNYIEENK